MNTDLYCAGCGVKVYTSRPVEWEHYHGSGIWELEDEGEWEEGAAECECCGKCFCEDCIDLDDDGVCPDCREESEDEDEDEYILF